MPMLEWEYGYLVFWALSLAASCTLLWLLVSKFRKKMTIAKRATKKTRGA